MYLGLFSSIQLYGIVLNIQNIQHIKNYILIFIHNFLYYKYCPMPLKFLENITLIIYKLFILFKNHSKTTVIHT